jgi:YVTN family beta-propeller protein
LDRLSRNKNTSRFSGAIFLALTCAASLALSQSRTVSNEPASEGRPITPAGSLVLDAATGLPAVGSLPVAFLRSPDHAAKDGAGRYLLSVNSGYGIQFSAATNPEQQSLSVLDLNAQPAPAVIQNVYFPGPQSVQVGAVFSSQPDSSGAYTLYVSGGFENKIWIFSFLPDSPKPISPPSDGPATKITAPSIDVDEFSKAAPTSRYNDSKEPVYPLGIALSADADSLFIANELDDSLGIIRHLHGDRRPTRVELNDGHHERFVYPYGVAVWSAPGSRQTKKVFISCWATASLAVVDAAHPEKPVTFVLVGKHPTAMLFNSARTRLYVANSDADSVSVIDPRTNGVVETISVRLAEKALPGGSPEGLALTPDGAVLYVANAHSNAVAVVGLSPTAQGIAPQEKKDKDGDDDDDDAKIPENRREYRSTVRGFIPTGQYPSALAVANGSVFVANGKGTGFENSSLVANDSGRAPNTSNDRFPGKKGREHLGGEYSVALIAGTISQIPEPDPRSLVDYTSQVMRNDGLLGAPNVHLFAGPSPIHHVIYIIRENRTYDEVFGDVEKSGDGTPADGDADLAIFGAVAAARRPDGPPQDITPNAHALAQRFGLLDRFFVNSEASPDGHNWADAAFSSDFVDKSFRWNYSGRGGSYDFQGTNRAPDIWPSKGLPPVLPVPSTPDDFSRLIRRYVPYLNGGHDVAEPGTLYLWDAAARAGITYRSGGEEVTTISQAQMDAFNENREREYPDVTPTVVSFPLKKALEGHVSMTHREFDLYTPDSMTADSYRAAKESSTPAAALISLENAAAKFRGYSRVAGWLAEFRANVLALKKGEPDSFPALNIVYLPNDHTNGLRPNMPPPQFYVADNDYALGLLVQEVSASPYWKDTAIFVLEDDAQDGPDHVDTHRSPALVISAYNRPGALVHQYHSTVSLIRTMELLIGLPPMNQLDASATPIDIFQAKPDLAPYAAALPDVALDNLIVQPSPDREIARMIRRSQQQNFDAPDLADPQALNRIIWFSVRGERDPYPDLSRLPAFDAMRTRVDQEADDEANLARAVKSLLARRTSQSHSAPSARN